MISIAYILMHLWAAQFCAVNDDACWHQCAIHGTCPKPADLSGFAAATCVSAVTGHREPCDGQGWDINPRQPTEHVIEIRTRRETRDVHVPDCVPAAAGSLLSICPYSSAQGACAEDELYAGVKLSGEKGHIDVCVRATRYLYVDGQKFGVLRETEDVK